MAMIMCAGLDANLYSNARVEGQIDRNMAIVTLQSSDLPLRLAEIVAREEKGASGLQSDGKAYNSDMATEQAFVIFDGSRSSLDSVMKGFKKAYKPNSIIFAMLTETARTWTLKDYLEELSAEHREMSKGGMQHEQKDS